MNREEFLQSVFPDYEPGMQPNPSIDAGEVRDLLDQVSDDTGIPQDWLDKCAGLVIDGLAGCRCLWYLHDVEGEIDVGKVRVPEWAQSIGYFAGGTISTEGGYGDVKVEIGPEEWRKGHIRLIKKKGEKTTEQTVKFGKWLERYIQKEGLEGTIQATRMRSDLKNRAKRDTLRWRISTHPYDVLTMSFNRPWSSCMRPESGHTAQYGILSDLAAGSAIMFFYAVGADAPLARLVLRPAVEKSGDPIIVEGVTVYGAGPKGLSAKDINHMLDHVGAGQVEAIRAKLCKIGHDGRALTHNIYSDSDGRLCTQDGYQYQRGYSNLQGADWPEPQLDVGELRAVALEWGGKIESDDLEEEIEIDVEEVAEEAAEYLFGGTGLEEMTEMYEERDLFLESLNTFYQEVHPEILAQAEDIMEDLIAIEEAVALALVDRITDMLNEERTMILAFLGEAPPTISLSLREFSPAVTAFRYLEDEKRWSSPVPPEVTEHLPISRKWRSREFVYEPLLEDPSQQLLFDQEDLEPPTVTQIVVANLSEGLEEALGEEYKELTAVEEAGIVRILEPGEFQRWELVFLEGI
jgi:hypothetical protein